MRISCLYIENNNLVRGLDYYTGTIYEVVIPSTDIGSIAAGGRYDKLLNILGSRNKLSAIGFATNNNNLSKIL